MKNSYKDFITILEDLKLDKNSKKALEKNFKDNERVFKEYEKNNSIDFIKVQTPINRLSLVCYELINLKYKYKEKDIPKEIFLSSIDDVLLLSNIYYEKNKEIGLRKGNIDWLQYLLNMDLFKLHTLQFQKMGMEYRDFRDGKEYMVFDDKTREELPIGTPVIAVHIQKGESLRPEDVDISFDMAKEFFNEFFPEHRAKVYTCNSWFLYSGNKEIMDENSNIIKFYNRFEILSEIQDNKQSIRRIYGKIYSKKEDYPQETSLQRNALNNFDKLGYGCGIIRTKDYI